MCLRRMPITPDGRPTRGVDVGAKSMTQAHSPTFREGKTILIFSSELPEIVNLCDTHLPSV